ncbi:hypothetical protein K7432_013240 [Basidiobolus ranarum]|uniref:Uncharacterized protein n=1 Tax=Basidiobolus ranarum TaxID=34480 RepID=A0ABR2WJL0_9FUNG
MKDKNITTMLRALSLLKPRFCFISCRSFWYIIAKEVECNQRPESVEAQRKLASLLKQVLNTINRKHDDLSNASINGQDNSDLKYQLELSFEIEGSSLSDQGEVVNSGLNYSKVGIEDNSIDLCISNCAMSLYPNKELEFYLSDVYANRSVPEEVRQHPILVGEHLGGALENEGILSPLDPYM